METRARKRRRSARGDTSAGRLCVHDRPDQRDAPLAARGSGAPSGPLADPIQARQQPGQSARGGCRGTGAAVLRRLARRVEGVVEWLCRTSRRNPARVLRSYVAVSSRSVGRNSPRSLRATLPSVQIDRADHRQRFKWFREWRGQPSPFGNQQLRLETHFTGFPETRNFRRLRAVQEMRRTRPARKRRSAGNPPRQPSQALPRASQSPLFLFSSVPKCFWLQRVLESATTPTQQFRHSATTAFNLGMSIPVYFKTLKSRPRY